MDNAVIFLEGVLKFIHKQDPLNYKKTKSNVERNRATHEREFSELLTLIYKFFSARNLTDEQVATSYLKMISDMRIEGLSFKKTGLYSCKSQHDANVKVYSNSAVMDYYMDALLMSQILWAHHFEMLIYFKQMLAAPLFKDIESVLDIGPGHGFFSFLTLEELPALKRSEIVDISESSLAMTKAILGDKGGMINYYKKDIFDYSSSEKYDLIILGEVLEHLDDPLSILVQLRKLLSSNGHLWITTPTNAPALDHVYLFKNKEEIEELLLKAKFKIVQSHGIYAEEVKPAIAERYKISYLYGALLTSAD